MKIDLIKPGIAVMTDPDPKTPILAGVEALSLRRSTRGKVWGMVRSHRDTWWVAHLDGTVAPYAFHELQPAPPAEIDPGLFPLG